MADTIVKFGVLGGTKEYKADGGAVSEYYSLLFPKVLVNLKVLVDNVVTEEAFSVVPVAWPNGMPLYAGLAEDSILKFVATGECNLHLHHTGTLTLQ